MELKFINPGIQYMINSIMEFQKEDTTPFWADSLYRFYPILDQEYARKLTNENRKQYLKKRLTDYYTEIEDTINDKVIAYSSYWDNNKTQIEEALSDAFEVDCTSLFRDMVCRVSMNPISPRFLKENTFEVFYLNSERGALGVSLHEIVHFVWFYVWNRTFHDNYEEYENPSLKWILSEMVVESIMKDERLSGINPCFKREHGGCVYQYFFDMKVEGRLLLETIEEMYATQSIRTFMKNSYEFCLLHEKEIRTHIKIAEGARN